eukprot:m.162805 g.162805  ORF g.162805 m.162805 type:complete len:106 (-) comp53064_c0_seq1:15-332(-)
MQHQSRKAASSPRNPLNRRTPKKREQLSLQQEASRNRPEPSPQSQVSSRSEACMTDWMDAAQADVRSALVVLFDRDIFSLEIFPPACASRGARICDSMWWMNELD